MTALSAQLVIALAVLAASAVVVAAVSRLGTARERHCCCASDRQLALVSLALTAVLSRGTCALAFAVVMLGVAVGTSAAGSGRGAPGRGC